ncbi:MAG TPA: hypothetical protein VKB92_01670 [Myxococcales bacterium]|nr:hypothetical protein [Myxococcales bacterium]
MTLIEQLQQTGIHRVGSPKTGLRWVGASKRDLARLEELKIPPAWTDVAVSRSPSSKLQAIGRDKKGRWQYRYSDEAVLERERRKYEKLVAFGKALPRLRKEIDRRLALRGLPREKVMGCILRILSTCFMRPGSEVYAKENGSFGIATLQNRHASAYEGEFLEPYFPTVEELITSVGRKRSACEAALLELLRKGRDATPIALAKKLARRGREQARIAKLSRRMRTPRMRKLARAFTLH